MKKLLVVLLAMGSTLTFAQGIKCTAEVSVAPQTPGSVASTKRVWLKPTTPEGKVYTAELYELNAFVKATVSNLNDVVLSATEAGGILSTSVTGSVNNNTVTLVLTAPGAVATVRCRK